MSTAVQGQKHQTNIRSVNSTGQENVKYYVSSVKVNNQLLLHQANSNRQEK